MLYWGGNEINIVVAKSAISAKSENVIIGVVIHIFFRFSDYFDWLNVRRE